jgi:pimeloyl-ACP methyl ester carboxylesterase
MKKPFLILISFLFSLSIKAQDITGEWNGILKVQGIQLRIVFNITKTENGYSTIMDSPDQGAKNIPVTSTSYENSKLKLTITNATIEYTGKLIENTINGTFKQAGQEFPLDFSKEIVQKKPVVRTQEPKRPYFYYSEEVTFENIKDTISLAGTLTLPKKEGGDYPVVILISGSGTQNRDSELLGHKPFLLISDYFTKKGIAVLRFDDRGVALSKGNFKTATTLDFASDVESAIAYLKTRKDINKNKIGLVGHSEGGIIAPIVASKTKDVKFIVLLAGTGISGNQLLLLQQELIAKVSGVPKLEIEKNRIINSKLFEMVIKSNDNKSLKTDLVNYLTESFINTNPKNNVDEKFVSGQVNQLTSPWMQYFIKHNPAIILEKVKCSVLAVNGEKDLQVPPKENLNAIKNALEKGGNNKSTIIEFPNLNHLFQECKTGSPSEYAEIEQTFSPIALEEKPNGYWSKQNKKAETSNQNSEI